MIFGQFRDGHPYVQLTIGDSQIEFLIDTGFEGDVTLPPDLITELCGPPTGAQIRRLADGSRVAVQVHTVTVDWVDESRLTEVLALDGPALLGTEILNGCELRVQVVVGGDVSIEPL